MPEPSTMQHVAAEVRLPDDHDGLMWMLSAPAEWSEHEIQQRIAAALARLRQLFSDGGGRVVSDAEAIEEAAETIATYRRELLALKRPSWSSER